ncbi:MAG: HAD family hydrolase [Candidatus Aminicenantales bacterium]
MKAVILDMDGVVADTEAAYLEAFNKLAERFNVKINRDEWFKRFPGTGPIPIMSTIFKEHGIEPKEGVGYWFDRWEEEYQKTVDKGAVKPVNGFLEFNRELNRLGVKKIIATGSHKRNAYIVLETFGIEKEFDIVGMEDITERKPSPQIFLIAAERLGTRPEDCIVFEDAPVGIAAAKAANMRCVALTTSTPRSILEKESPDLIIKDYRGIGVGDLLRL